MAWFGLSNGNHAKGNVAVGVGHSPTETVGVKKVVRKKILSIMRQQGGRYLAHPVKTGIVLSGLTILNGLGGSLLAFALPGDALAQTTAPQTDSTTQNQQRTVAEVERIDLNRRLAAQEVTERQQPGYAPQGTHLGAFTINPGLDVSGGYTDNLYSTKTDRKSDYFTTITPSVFAVSNWNVHELQLYASDRLERYLDNTDEDSNNYDLFARGKIDVMRGTWFAFKPSYVVDHEKRSSPDAVVGGKEPVQVTTKELDFTAEHKPSRLWFRPDASAKAISFSDSQLSNGTSVNNADRNRKELEGGLRAGYELTPGYSAFVEGRANDRSYDSAVDDSGYRRDSSGYQARVGAEIELTGKLKGDVFVGYMWQSYDDTRFQNLSAPVYGTGLTWNATGLTTVKLTVARTIEETTIAQAAGNLQNSFEVGVDHELRRNVILSASGKYSHEDFRGIDRNDDIYEAKLKATYQINRRYKLYSDYSYSTRSSTSDSSEYRINTVSIGIAALF